MTPERPDHEPASAQASAQPSSLAAGPGAPVFVLEGFMTDDEIARLRDYAEQHPGDFHPAKVGSSDGGRVDHSRRRALVMYPGPLARQIRERITAVLPRAQEALGLPTVPAERVDVQITASLDGGFYNRHSDSSSAPTAGRKISYVFFVHRSPPAFTGGELVLYPHGPADLRSGRLAISPDAGRIVFFPSGLMHEIMPVHTAADTIEGARLTVNGWIHWQQRAG